jgi:hypothetical protein
MGSHINRRGNSLFLKRNDVGSDGGEREGRSEPSVLKELPIDLNAASIENSLPVRFRDDWGCISTLSSLNAFRGIEERLNEGQTCDSV